MKNYTGVFALIGLVVVSLFALRWFKNRTAIVNPSAVDKDDMAATVQSANRDKQAAEATSIIPPKASWVRPNGAMLDLNQLGGSIPPLVTLPKFNAWE